MNARWIEAGTASRASVAAAQHSVVSTRLALNAGNAVVFNTAAVSTPGKFRLAATISDRDATGAQTEVWSRSS